MTPQTPRNYVYLLKPTFGVSLSHDSQLDPLELGGVQSQTSYADNLNIWEVNTLRYVNMIPAKIPVTRKMGTCTTD